MGIGSHDDGTVITECREELLLGLDHYLVVHLVGTTTVFGQSTYIFADVGTMATERVGHRLLALDELDVQLLDDVELDGLVVIAGLIPRAVAKILLQILRLELPAMTCQDLIAHESQIILGETSQISGIQQTVGKLVADGLLFQLALNGETAFQVVGRQGHLPHGIAVGVADSQEVHTFLTDILHAPAYLRT